MSSQYVMATIEMPLLLYPDGTYDAMNDRVKVSFSAINQLPDIQTKTSINMGELLSQLGRNPDEPYDTQDTELDGFVFKNITSDSPQNNTEEVFITQQPDIGPDPDPAEQSETDAPIYIYGSELKGRRKASASKTFKSRHPSRVKQYTRKIYGVSP